MTYNVYNVSHGDSFLMLYPHSTRAILLLRLEDHMDCLLMFSLYPYN